MLIYVLESDAAPRRQQSVDYWQKIEAYKYLYLYLAHLHSPSYCTVVNQSILPSCPTICERLQYVLDINDMG